MENRIREIIAEILTNRGKSYEISTITNDTKLRDDIGLDSFNLAELTVYVEEEFEVDIFEDGIVLTFGEIIQKLKPAGE